MDTYKFELVKIPFIQNINHELEITKEYKILINSIVNTLTGNQNSFTLYIYTKGDFSIAQIIYEVPKNLFIERVFLESKYFVFKRFDGDLDITSVGSYNIYRKYKMFPVINKNNKYIDKYSIYEHSSILPLDYENSDTVFLLPIISTFYNDQGSDRWHNVLDFFCRIKSSACIKITAQLCDNIIEYIPYASKCLNLLSCNYHDLFNNEFSNLYHNIILDNSIFNVNIQLLYKSDNIKEQLYYSLLFNWGNDKFSKNNQFITRANDSVKKLLGNMQCFFSLEELIELLLPPYFKNNTKQYYKSFIPKPFVMPQIKDNEEVVINNYNQFNDNNITLGKLDNQNLLTINQELLRQHLFICGTTGSGKTTFVQWILKKLPEDIHFMIIDPVKDEYISLAKKVRVVDFNKEKLKLNPFAVPKGVNIHTHSTLIARVLATVIPMTINGFDYFLGIIKETYKRKIFASQEIKKQIEIIHRLTHKSKSEIKNEFEQKLFEDKNISSILETFPETLPNYDDIFMYGYKWIDDIILLNNNNKFLTDADREAKRYFEKWKEKMKVSHPLIVNTLNDKTNTDFRRLIDEDNLLINLFEYTDINEKKAMLLFFVGILDEIRRSKGKSEKLKHITVLEEAHIIMPINSREYSDNMVTSADVEVSHIISNLLAEIRYFGEGMIIAEQSPSKIIPDVLINTSTKIIKRLSFGHDIEYISEAIGLNEEQKEFLLSLSKEESIVYLSGASKPMYITYDYRE